MYKITGTPTNKQIELFDERRDLFYRFHNPEYEMNEDSKSWGMIYSSEDEAREDYEYEGLDPDDAVLEGKSCVAKFDELGNYLPYFNKNYVVVAFSGSDTGEEGHDGEYVATFYEAEAVWSYDDAGDLLSERDAE